jgi:hypothetical protein
MPENIRANASHLIPSTLLTPSDKSGLYSCVHAYICATGRLATISHDLYCSANGIWRHHLLHCFGTWGLASVTIMHGVRQQPKAFR